MMKSTRNFYLLLILLILGDFIFIALNLKININFIIKYPRFHIGRDRGFPEIYQYLKYLFIIAMLILFVGTKRACQYASWALLFIYFLLDDALRIHDGLGAIIAKKLSFKVPFNLRLHEIGEIIVTGMFGVPLLAFLLYCHIRGSQAFKSFSYRLSGLTFIFLFFGIIVDMIHTAFRFQGELNHIFLLIEDGGEMISLSLIVCYIAQVTQNRKHYRFGLVKL